MTPKPTHPDSIRPLGGGIKQRFVKSRFGWYVHTTHNCFIREGTPFAFTRAGIERKAARIVRALARSGQAQTFEHLYDERGRPPIMRADGGYSWPPARPGYTPPPPSPAPDGLGHRERTP